MKIKQETNFIPFENLSKEELIENFKKFEKKLSKILELLENNPNLQILGEQFLKEIENLGIENLYKNGVNNQKKFLTYLQNIISANINLLEQNY